MRSFLRLFADLAVSQAQRAEMLRGGFDRHQEF